MLEYNTNHTINIVQYLFGAQAGHIVTLFLYGSKAKLTIILLSIEYHEAKLKVRYKQTLASETS